LFPINEHIHSKAKSKDNQKTHNLKYHNKGKKPI
jgi:hypothetical protein